MWNSWFEGAEGREEEDGTMEVKCQISVSLDGFAAGPRQSTENPLGEGGMQLHEWVFPLEAWRRPHGLEGGEVNASSAVLEAATANVGATVMGRNMFGGGPGDWGDGSWTGWWGEDPPFHTPVFVLTHHEREPLEMEGGTTFHFVTGGVEAALDLATEAAGGADIAVGGGPDTVRQLLRAGLLDEMWLHVAPVLLGSGERLLDGLGGDEPGVQQIEAVAGEGVAHLRYRVGP